MYSLLCRHAKMSLLPNQQAADEELSTYYQPGVDRTAMSSPFKRFLEKHKKLRTCLLLFVLFGACMVIGDGVLTPTISGMHNMSLFLCFVFLSLIMATYFRCYQLSHLMLCLLQFWQPCLDYKTRAQVD